MRFGTREILVMGVVLAIPVASYALVFMPQNKGIARAREEIALKREMLEKLRSETARNEDLAKANEEIRARIAEIEARLPSGKEVDSIVRQVSEIAVNSGLGAPSMESGKPVPSARYMEQPIAVTTAGNFDGFYRFLQQLERLPRITKITDFTLKRDTKVDGQVAMEFTLSIYFEDAKP